jgi:hypothetical protein
MMISIEFDAGISGGLGFDAVNFGVRYNYGINKIGKDDSLHLQMLKQCLSAYIGLRLNQ